MQNPYTNTSITHKKNSDLLLNSNALGNLNNYYPV